MREIKFRAWDIEQKVMRDNPDPQIIQAVIFGNDYNGRVKLMQYTGLKDKNGKEIYEGDICKFYSYMEEKSKISDVVFIEGGFELRSSELVREVLEYTKEDKEPKSFNLEVIGNIYENPELLKGG